MRGASKSGVRRPIGSGARDYTTRFLIILANCFSHTYESRGYGGGRVTLSESRVFVSWKTVFPISEERNMQKTWYFMDFGRVAAARLLKNRPFAPTFFFYSWNVCTRGAASGIGLTSDGHGCFSTKGVQVDVYLCGRGRPME